jgi:hypothetical protein
MDHGNWQKYCVAGRAVNPDDPRVRAARISSGI